MQNKQTMFEDLNKEQLEAVTHKSGPLLIIAGAGTGKTTVITKRIANLVLSKQAQAEEILALTFTNKAAEEMEERVDKLLPYGYVESWISTFHNFCQRIISEHGIDIGISSDVELLDSLGAWILVSENFEKFDLDYYKPRNNPTKFIKSMLSHFSHLKDEEISPEKYLEYARGLALDADSADFIQKSAKEDEPKKQKRSKSKKVSKKEQFSESRIEEIKRINETAGAYCVYDALLREKNKMDFGDLINYCLKLFRERPNVLDKYREKFKYVLVDEFQDTNWAQYDLVKMISSPKNNITVVADDDQSIYRFRGASMSNVMQFSKDYKDAVKISLVKNYRSGKKILDASYSFIQLNNPNRLEHVEKISKKLESASSLGSVVEHFHCKTSQDEASVVARAIISLKEKDKSSNWSDFAILVRANSHSEQFASALESFGAPFKNYSTSGIYKTSLVMNIMSFLKVLDDYHESRALFRLLSAPFLNIPPEDIVRLTHHAYKKSVSLYDVVKNPQLAGVSDQNSLREIEKLMQWIQKYSKDAKSKKTSLLLLDWLNDGYIQYLQSLPDGESAESFRILKSFYDHIKGIEEVINDSRVCDIARILGKEMETKDGSSIDFGPESDPDTVKIMTIHAAKGLEFKYVFIVNLVDRRFPTMERKEQIEIPSDLIKEVIPEGNSHLEEERRLFYVAMTRAKSGLFFTTAENYSGVQKKKISIFLKELSEVYPDLKISSKTLEASADNFFRRPSLREKIFKPALPSRFSFTQLKIFDECPFAYKMQFLLKVPLPGKFVFSYGTTMHSTLQAFMQSVSRASRSYQVDLFSKQSDKKENSAEKESSIPGQAELLDIYEKKWIGDWYESEEQKNKYKKSGRQALVSFHDKLLGQKPPLVKSLERPFNLKIGEYTIMGKMDRVDALENGSVSIIDYKTGSVPKDGKLSLADKRQLLIYQIASEEVFKEKVEKLVFYYLDQAREIEFIGTQEEKNEVKKWVLDTIEKIKTSSFDFNPKEHICDYCEYFFDIQNF